MPLVTSGQCPLWVRSRHSCASASCPLCLRKRTFARLGWDRLLGDCEPWNWIVPDLLVKESGGGSIGQTMRSKPETLEVHAECCTRMAAAAHDSRLKSLFLDMACQWRELAAATRSLEADAKARETNFFAERARERETGANFSPLMSLARPRQPIISRLCAFRQ